MTQGATLNMAAGTVQITRGLQCHAFKDIRQQKQVTTADACTEIVAAQQDNNTLSSTG